MLYDKRVHIANLVDKMLVEDLRGGNVTALEMDKIGIVKLLGDTNGFKTKIEAIDSEHSKRKSLLIDKIEGLQKQIKEESEKLDQVEKDYWESIVGAIIRTNDSIVVTPPPVEIDE